MDEPQVDVVRAKASQTCVDRLVWVVGIVLEELGGNEDLFPADPAIAHGLAHFGLVAVHGCSVDMAVTGGQGVQHSLVTAPARQAPRTEAK